jgi:tRNA 2-thiouridine synthesizing protein A
MGFFSKKKGKADTSTAYETQLEDGTTIKVSAVIDCLGDSCPRPQLMTKAAMDKAQSGENIEIQIDNPTSVEAIPPMMSELGGTHLATNKKDRYWQVLLNKN